MRGITIMRLVYVLPLAVSPVAAAAAWKALFDTDAGWVNYILGELRLPRPNWLANVHTAMPSVVIVDAWTGITVVTIILLAGLLSLDPAPAEAARIDGASELRVLSQITLPSLAPVLGFAIALRLFDLLRQFGLFDLLTGGGPGWPRMSSTFTSGRRHSVTGSSGTAPPWELPLRPLSFSRQ